MGWYYSGLNDRAPAWTSVQFLHRFLTQNKSVGPYAREADLDTMELGDVIQLGNDNGTFCHSLLVCGFVDGDILVCAHDFNALMRPLSTYVYSQARPLHIVGVRFWT